MQAAHQSLKAEWRRLGKEVLNLLDDREWMPGLNDSSTWSGWLDAQWQTYWSAVPIGDENQELKDTGIFRDKEDWVEAQNKAYDLKGDRQLFLDKELAFLKATFGYKKPGVNIGSWWAYIFDRTRFTLTAAKNARNWQIPTAFGCRSTVSGLGSAVYPENFSDRNDWVSEADIDKLWDKQVGLFDGIEKLNATEVLKRGLPRILSSAVFPDKAAQWREASYYPDLSSGVAGWLRQSPTAITYYQDATAEISDRFRWTMRSTSQITLGYSFSQGISQFA